MGNYDAWLEAPYQDSLRNGEAVEALEIQFQDSDEFQDFFENWQQDEMSEFQPLYESPLDTFLGTSTYARALNAYIEAWVANNAEHEWEVDDTPESDEALRAWDNAPVLSLRKRVARLLAKVVGR
jgi:hypothetical protein